MPTTLRIALLTGLLALLSNLAVIGFVYWQTYDDGIIGLRRELAAQARELGDIYKFGGLEGLRSEVAAEASADGPDNIISLLGSRNEVLAGNLAPGFAAHVSLKPGTSIGMLQRVGEPRSHEAVIVVRRAGSNWIIRGQLSGGGLALRQLLEKSLFIGAGLSLLLGLLCAGLIARFVGRQITDIAQVTEKFADGDFTGRAVVGTGDDAFAKLSRQINSMLDRIGTLMSELHMLSDSLAHDLRSPIGRLRTAADAARCTDDAVERKQLLASVIRQSDELSRILGSVLEIGRSESASVREQFAPFDPARLVAEVAEMYEPLAEDRGIAVVFDGPANASSFFGHRQLLAQALSNLVENSLAYGAVGKEIRLRFIERGNALIFGVSDRGPGIAPEDQPVARRRFGRLDPSRSGTGAGLGLALVEAVARAHGGELTLSDNQPGLDAVLSVPRRVVRGRVAGAN